MSIQESIQQYVKKLVEVFHPQKVLLFGSQAAGTAGPDSDVDLLIVMDHDKARDVEQEPLLNRNRKKRRKNYGINVNL